jgi:hypothetical protein
MHKKSAILFLMLKRILVLIKKFYLTQDDSNLLSITFWIVNPVYKPTKTSLKKIWLPAIILITIFSSLYWQKDPKRRGSPNSVPEVIRKTTRNASVPHISGHFLSFTGTNADSYKTQAVLSQTHYTFLIFWNLWFQALHSPWLCCSWRRNQRLASVEFHYFAAVLILTHSYEVSYFNSADFWQFLYQCSIPGFPISW